VVLIIGIINALRLGELKPLKKIKLLELGW
jgi:hypothetical protein